MTKWLVSGLIAVPIVILALVWHFGMKPSPIGLIKPSPFHSSEVTGQVLADRFFVDIQRLSIIVFASRNEKNLVPVGKAFVARLPERGIRDVVILETVSEKDLAEVGNRKLILFLPYNKADEMKKKLIEAANGQLMIWSDGTFAVEESKANELQELCNETDVNAYVSNTNCRSARYSKIHLRKRLDPSKPYFGAQRLGTFDYELYFYTP